MTGRRKEQGINSHGSDPALPEYSDLSTLLTHWGRVTHICVSKQGHHRSRKWLVAWSASSHYLNRWWNIVNWTLRNKVQWNRKQNSCIFIQENAFENVVWKMAVFLSRPQCVNHGWCDHMATKIWVNIGSGNGLLLDGTKPLPESMLTYHQSGPVNIF